MPSIATQVSSGHVKRGRKTFIPGSTETIKEYNKIGSVLRPDKYAKRSPVIPIARWITNLFPSHEVNACLRAAVLLGTNSDGSEIMLPQMKCYKRKTAYAYHHSFEGDEYDKIWDFGDQICTQSFGSIIRTALAAGLQLPGWRAGGYRITKLGRLPVHLWVSLLHRSGVRPSRPDLIDQEIYEMLDIEAVDAGLYVSI